eukprot:scaffold18507_cov49-Attheya_sp.AAC.4
MMGHFEDGTSRDEEMDHREPSPFTLEGSILSQLKANYADRCAHLIMGSTEVVDSSTISTNANGIPSDCIHDSDEDAMVTEESDRDVALLLTSLSAIASKEVPASSEGPRHEDNLCTLFQSNSLHHINESESNRARTVSVSSLPSENYYFENPREDGTWYSMEHAIHATPPQSPRAVVGRRPRSVSTSSVEMSPLGMSSSPITPKRHSRKKVIIQPNLDVGTAPLSPRKGGPFKKILRKKFSWKNFPELEAFLIANREEYLRHSTLNYTVQQKQYNNRLTERMIELAAEQGYSFDQEEFSFVTVRDRIRCYYKSLKKRGVIIGYAARKAGMIGEDELERSAAMSGKIYTPTACN